MPKLTNTQKKLLQLQKQALDQIELIREREYARQAVYSAPRMAELLGYTLVDKIHYEIEERIKNRTKPHYMLLMHRHGLKTTIFNYCDNVCRVLQDPKTTGLIYSATHPLAKSMLDATKNLLENNEKIIKFFGNQRGDIWTNEYIRVAGAIGSIADNTYTIETGGVEKGLASKHYHWIKIDDIVNEDNYEHPSSRELVLKRFRAIFNLLKRAYTETGKWPAEVCVLGTRYHPSDVYETIISEMEDLFEIIIVPPTREVNGVIVPTLPKVFPTLASLEPVKIELGAYGYACQMEQNPHFEASNCLKWDNIKVIPDEELKLIFSKMKANQIPQKELALIMDPADETTRGANHTGIALIRYNENTLDILRVWKLKMLLDDTLNITAKILYDTGVQNFFCEKSGLESNVQYYLALKLKEYRIDNYVQMEGVSHGKEAKTSRIMALQPFIEAGKVRRGRTFLHPVSHGEPPKDMFKLLENEVRSFPNLGQDDLLDPIAYSLRREVFDLATNIITPPAPAPSKKNQLEQWNDELIRSRADIPQKRVRSVNDEDTGTSGGGYVEYL